ncbi:hypothetical protein BBJ29_010113 [Phytophthora kernoviae]|uniref:Uncharacterized protein n=1 Tax=Phytophthora kernoviae TaxID=325452 RepID=A0A421G4L5_9STRA|nr:hypothetical protein BBJ29_010113 [Phytophthora kernoviae]
MMVRSKVGLVLLAIAVNITGARGIDWTFWDDDDSADSPSSKSSSVDMATLSPETLGSSYLDMINSVVEGSSDSSSEDDSDDETIDSDTDSDDASSLALVSESSSLDISTMADNLATPTTATSTITSTRHNWVGPWTLSSDTACYREAHIMDTCPSNYDRNDLTNTCWTECPLTYPVECGMSCIQQNNDCGREVLAKVSAVAMATLSMATAGVFGEFSKVEPTDISTLLAEFIQTICGPTQFMGEIDDGTEDATLGLNALKKAFKGSSSSWTKKGDGAVIINFTSKDTKDVTVNIMSGGDKIDKVNVAAGSTATWSSNTTALGGKTLYLDRWRPGFLGLPGTGGGSLVLWVPIARQGGHLEIEAQLNAS